MKYYFFLFFNFNFIGMDFNFKKIANDASGFFTRAKQVNFIDLFLILEVKYVFDSFGNTVYLITI